MKKKILNVLWELGVPVLAAIVISHFVIKPVQVKGSSMYPTLKDGDYAVSNVMGKTAGSIDRYDVVIVYLPEKSEYIVKRVIGLPGETVEYTGDQLYINGEPVDEPFLSNEYKATYKDENKTNFTSDIAPITLGDDEYYCLGDNRPRSSDSRVYGAFHKAQIKSKGVCVLYPLSEAGVETW